MWTPTPNFSLLHLMIRVLETCYHYAEKYLLLWRNLLIGGKSIDER